MSADHDVAGHARCGWSATREWTGRRALSE